MPQDKMRRTLLDRVQMYEFAVIEANLCRFVKHIGQ